MRPLFITSGEPAGVGPELCLDLIQLDVPLVVLADKELLKRRATLLGRTIAIDDYVVGQSAMPTPGRLSVLSTPCPVASTPGVLNLENVPYVLTMLSTAVSLCLQHKCSGLVTAPVHKGIINNAGIAFTGHTEFIANQCGVDPVVMMLSCDAMRVALITTHLPLKQVSESISYDLITKTITCLHHSLQRDFAIKHPKIYVAGLNPHAGEGGHLGLEEIKIITPALNHLRSQGIDVHGPFPADTMFTPKNSAESDVFVAMYHDQGLAVLKYVGFGKAVNITLGLPIIRTSVDHGTALDLAGSGQADSGSLLAAVTAASRMVQLRLQSNEN
jgi:4-hydroxythreonine-4-phosphate dehydrogenase